MDAFNPTQMPKNEYRFSQDDLRKMYHFGDVEEKALISLAVSYGQGSKDFLNLKSQKLRDVIDETREKNKDFAMWISEGRQKSGITPVSFLTPEAIESVDAYLQLLEKKQGKLPKFIWCSSKREKHISNEGLNKKLRRLVTKANIKTGKKNVHFHCIRKFTFSRLRRIDKDMAKVICGKSVSVSDMTYEEIEDQAEKVFRLAYKNLALNGNLSGKNMQKQQEQIDNMKQAIQQIERENSTFKTRIDLLQETTNNQQKKVEELQENLDGTLDNLLNEDYLVMHRETAGGKKFYTLVKIEKLDEKTAKEYIQGKRKLYECRNCKSYTVHKHKRSDSEKQIIVYACEECGQEKSVHYEQPLSKID
jgi:hypothetical protein